MRYDRVEENYPAQFGIVKKHERKEGALARGNW